MIDEESIESNISTIADIEKLPKEKSVQILEHIIFVERPALLLEASKIPQLQETIKNLTAEKDFFLKELKVLKNCLLKLYNVIMKMRYWHKRLAS